MNLFKGLSTNNLWVVKCMSSRKHQIPSNFLPLLIIIQRINSNTSDFESLIFFVRDLWYFCDFFVQFWVQNQNFVKVLTYMLNSILSISKDVQ